MKFANGTFRIPLVLIFKKFILANSLKSIIHKVALMITLETKPTFLLHFSVTSDFE